MKICIVCSRLCYGGAERVAVMWANGFVNKGHNVFLISNLYEEKTYHVDSQIHLLNLVATNHNKIKKWCSAIWNVRKVVKNENPDVIVGVMETCSLVALLSTIGISIPIVMTDHYAFDRTPFGSFSKIEKLNKFYLNKIYDIVTVLTEADKSIIGQRLNNVVVMPNPLSLPSIEMRNFIKTNVLLAVGRLDAWYVKGFDVLIRAFGKLVQGLNSKVHDEGWKLQIAGTGSEDSLNFLKQLCKENGVEDSVEFLGFRKDVEKLYQEASAFVLSSRYEGFGLVLIEAMSQGCACIACDYKGRQREIMCPEGQGSMFNVQSSNNKVELCETGILCEPDDVEALAEAMKKMIMDDEYRESVRAKAIERSKYYSIENTMDRWEKLLTSVQRSRS